MFGGVETLLVDVTERPTNRPKDAVQQTEHHSGKKRRSCLKNTIISTLGLIVLYIGATFPGKNHDYGMFKKEFNKDLSLFERFNLMVDLGYKGIETDYKTKQIYIPYKKPRKSKSNPSPQLTAEQKQYNKKVGSKRVFVEHAIGGIKRYKCLSDKFRNRRESGIDFTMMLAAAGLWNLNLIFK